MSIFSPATTPVSQPLAVNTATGAPASSAQGPFGAQLQSLRAGHSSASSTSTQTAYQAQPKHGPSAKAHHPRGRYASDTDSNAANGTQNSPTTTGVPTAGNSGIAGGGIGSSGTSATGNTGQQSPGGALLASMMRGLQAYGATAMLA